MSSLFPVTLTLRTLLYDTEISRKTGVVPRDLNTNQLSHLRIYLPSPLPVLLLTRETNL